MRRGDQGSRYESANETLLEGNPHVRVHVPVFVIQLDVVLQLVLCEDVCSVQ